ncbi:HPF/RaiA family ribosome-associated protein [Zoogloea sp.]|uniref:HPF/RaiA family ribosome-associated protein n=1 Tax=Zoogloea sp. TaxID=49181 RepID=UPI001A5DF6BB|nr:HPF/RaiA family ribosome-associated protein [Zoogloea sp.]
MEVQIKARGLPAAKNLRNHASRRIRAALGRFGHAVQSVTVRLSDINGPRGGADKLCRIVIQMKSRSIVMEELGNDMRRVIDRLSERVQFNVSRQMEKISRVNRQLMQPPELIPLPI